MAPGDGKIIDDQIDNLAEWNGSDLFCIGNELRQMTRYETEWRDLIATVRRIYHGPITYGAHWESEFEKLPFWDAVDYIGLNNYFPLTRNGDASAEALQKGADEVLLCLRECPPSGGFRLPLGVGAARAGDDPQPASGVARSGGLPGHGHRSFF